MTEEEFYNSFPTELKEELAVFFTLPKKQQKEAFQEISEKYHLTPATLFYLLTAARTRSKT